ncbi:site-2 protease family protein, partial [Halorubrum lacusprofundi]
ARRKPETPLWRWLLNNYLFIRIPLVRPAHWLARLMPWVSWLFSGWFLAVTALAAVTGIVLAARQLDVVETQLRGALSWDGAFGFAAALVVSKLLHELGHAFVSTRHGVRVGHMGIALLVMWPMPYTDTGESWKLQRSRNRFAIASAGRGTWSGASWLLDRTSYRGMRMIGEGGWTSCGLRMPWATE